jgi:hypothetical protein
MRRNARVDTGQIVFRTAAAPTYQTDQRGPSCSIKRDQRPATVAPAAVEGPTSGTDMVSIYDKLFIGCTRCGLIVLMSTMSCLGKGDFRRE